MLTCNDMTRAKKKVRRQCFAPLGVAYRTKASHNVNINHILFQNDKRAIQIPTLVLKILLENLGKQKKK